MSPKKLPGVDATPPDQIVIHVDMDCFYASCERLREPALCGEPVVVGMGYEDGDDAGAVATASYEAREHGVESAMGITEALDRLPREASDSPTGEYRPVDMEYYESVSGDVMSVLDEYADVLRKEGIDEAYLDVSEQTDWRDAHGHASKIKSEIRTRVGVPASVGVAPTMSIAKIASDYDKPDGIKVVTAEEVEQFLYPLDVDQLHGVGPVTARELREMGVETAGDLVEVEPSVLTDRFGERGTELYRCARGLDDRSVTPRDDPKSFSRESAFADSVTDIEVKREVVEELAEDVADRVQHEGATYQTVGIKVVSPPYDVRTREKSLSGPTDNPEIVRTFAIDLLHEFNDVPIRKLGVRASNLGFAAGEQATFDDWEGSNSVDDHPRIPSEDNGQSELADFVDGDDNCGA